MTKYVYVLASQVDTDMGQTADVTSKVGAYLAETVAEATALWEQDMSTTVAAESKAWARVVVLFSTDPSEAPGYAPDLQRKANVIRHYPVMLENRIRMFCPRCEATIERENS